MEIYKFSTDVHRTYKAWSGTDVQRLVFSPLHKEYSYCVSGGLVQRLKWDKNNRWQADFISQSNMMVGKVAAFMLDM